MCRSKQHQQIHQDITRPKVSKRLTYSLMDLTTCNQVKYSQASQSKPDPDTTGGTIIVKSCGSQRMFGREVLRTVEAQDIATSSIV